MNSTQSARRWTCLTASASTTSGTLRALDKDRRGGGWSDRPRHDRFAAALPTGANVLDFGCGSGAPVALNMAACGLAVTGIDASPSLISLCRERMLGHCGSSAACDAAPIRGRFNGVLAWDSFFHLRPHDRRRMFRVFADHSGSHAILMFNAGPAQGEAVGLYRGDPLYHASLAPADDESLLDAIGFDVVAHARDDHDVGGRTVWLARSRSSFST